MNTRHRRAKTTAQGTPKRAAPSSFEHFRPEYQAPPAILALLRSIWGKRDALDQHARDMVWSFLGRVRSGPLTDRQLDAAAKIGAAHGIGFDDPRLDDPPAPAPRSQPWGPLPRRPPGR